MAYVYLAFYVIQLVITIIIILLNTHSTSKTLAYLLLIILLPGLGTSIYFAFGKNLRHQKSNKKAYAIQRLVDAQLKELLPGQNENLVKRAREIPANFQELEQFVDRIFWEKLRPATATLLRNGEVKFPEMLKMLSNAKSSIHLEYYSWENDVRGNEIMEVLLNKHQEGITIRVLYDDYASRKIKHNIVKKLKDAGIAIHPKIKVKLRAFASRVNHRDHRKIVIVDGKIAFVGGINLSDRYDNSIDTGLYWRDTHVKLEGPLAWNIQRHFVVSWNTSQPHHLVCDINIFPAFTIGEANGNLLGQIVAGGPIYPLSNIMLTYARIFSLARKRLWITNPYFIPSDSILDALKLAAISGADVRILMPLHSDSVLVAAASRFYYQELLDAGVKIFLYNRGFVHAKTVVADSYISVVGTANMDIRSFDLNFEIMSLLYDYEFVAHMEMMFENDLKDSVEVTRDQWRSKGIVSRLWWSVARLLSEFL